MRSAWPAVLCSLWRTCNGAISNAFAQPLICWPRIPGLPVGDYRIVYEVFDRVLVVQVVRIGHRREVYR